MNNPSDVIQKMPLLAGNEQELQFLKVLGSMLDEIKYVIDSYTNAFDIHLCPPELLPYLAATLGVKDEYPYLGTVEEQRKFIEYLFEANKYKGTEYSLYLLLRGIFDLNTVSVREGYKYCLMTWRRGNGWNGGTTYSSRVGTRIWERAKGLPVDSRLFSNKYKPNSIFVNVTSPLSSGLSSMNTKFTLAQSLVHKYVPEVVETYFSISGYTAVEVVSMPIDVINMRELDAGFVSVF